MAKTAGVLVLSTIFRNQTPKMEVMALTNTIKKRCYSSSEKRVDICNADESRKFRMDLTNLTNPCLVKKTEKKPRKLKSMWGEPIKHEYKNEDGIVRADEIHYKVSEKSRLYQQTWRDCPSPIYGLKKFCGEGAIPPKFIKRPKPIQKSTNSCVNNTKCPKIVMPYCRKAYVGRCVHNRKFEEYCRIVPPFPSYSECLKDPLKDLPPSECRCVRETLVKEDILRKRKIANLK